MNPPVGNMGDPNELNEEERTNSRGRGRGPWLNQAPIKSPGALRRPHHAVGSNQAVGLPNIPNSDQKIEAGSCHSTNANYNRHSDSVRTDEIIKNSNLSVNAAEFVPRKIPAPLKRPSVQSRLEVARGNVEPHQQIMQHYVHYSNQCYENQQSNSQHYESYEYDEDAERKWYQNNRTPQAPNLDTTMKLLDSAMYTLTLNPGRFDCLIDKLKDSIIPHLEIADEFRQILNAVIQKSMSESNFRYSGARLCKCLDTEARKKKVDSDFRSLLFSLCEDEIRNRSITWERNSEHSEDDQKKCHGMILFLAELVVQMEDSPIGLEELLIQLITTVLKSPAPNSVKQICQALKLAGQTLERDKHGSNRKGMETMMRALTQLVTEGRLDSSVNRMVTSVHELRNGNWGRSSNSSNSTDGHTGSNAMDGPVFYGPDGAILTAEESQFLQDNMKDEIEEEHIIPDRNEEDCPEYFQEDADDDYDEAYEEFLKTLPVSNSKK